MKSTDEDAFAAMLTGVMTDVYDKAIKPTLIDLWIASLQPYDLADVQTALMRYVTDPADCKFPPKPGDIIRHLPIAATDDHHPGPDEAWGMLLRLIGNERETGVLTDEMRAGWAACQPILDLGDEVGARMCFLDVYRCQLQEARQNGFKARWSVTLGVDPTLRVQRLNEAVAALKISADHAHSLLPSPTPVSLEAVAGLLEGPEASPQDVDTSRRFRDLAQRLRDSRVESDRRWAEQRQQQREAEIERKRQIQAQVEAELQKREIRTAPTQQEAA